VSAGDTVHFCGTISSNFIVQGSGSEGSVITFLWESGGKFSAGNWGVGGAAIDFNGKSYLTFDGGTNGVIEATTNGSGLATEYDLKGIYSHTGQPVEVTIKNLTIQGMYVRNDDTESNGVGAMIDVYDVSDFTVQDCILINAFSGFRVQSNSYAMSNINITNTKITKVNRSIIATRASYNLDGIVIDGCDFDDAIPWHSTTNAFHGEYIQLYASSGVTGKVQNVTVKNSTFGWYTKLGRPSDSTAFIYPSKNVESLTVFNCIFNTPSGTSAGANGTLFLNAETVNATYKVYNNVFVGESASYGKAISTRETDGTVTAYVYNNIFSTYGRPYYNDGGVGTFNHDYNQFYNISGVTQSEIEGFGVAGETHSAFNSNPNFVSSSDYQLTASSWGIDHGCSTSCGSQNLTALFTTDKLGNTRSGTWDIGAYEYSGIVPLVVRYVDVNLASNCAGNYSIANRTCSGTDGYAYTTVAAGVAATTTPGDALYIRSGTYLETINIAGSGNSTNRILISGYGSETAIIDGNHSIPGYWGTLVTVSGQYVTLRNLEIKRSAWIGIKLSGNYSYAENIYAHHHMEQGMLLSGNYNIADGCLIYYNAMRNEDPANYAGGGWATGISAARTPYYATIKNCIVWNNWGEGLSTFEAYYTTLEDNIVYDNQTNVYISDAEHVTVQRNLIYSTPGNALYNAKGYQAGIMMGNELQGPTNRYHKIINNFVAGNKENFYWWQNGASDGLLDTVIANNTFVNSVLSNNVRVSYGVHSNCVFSNNIILQENSLTTTNFGTTSGWTFDKNLMNKAGAQTLGATTIIADPLLTKSGSLTPGSLTGDYFKTSALSPAINAAVVLSDVDEDFYGTDRGAAPDIGGYEYAGEDTAPPTVQNAAVNGSTVTINFSENVTTTNYVAGDFNLDCTSPTATNISLSSPSGSGSTRTFTVATPIVYGQSCNLDYLGRSNGIEDTSGNDLLGFSDTVVTNDTPDTTAPVVSGGSPSTEQECTSDPRSVTVAVTTNEAATCRMATSDMAYGSMTDVFTTTGGTSHSESKSLSCGETYNYYVRCSDTSGNANSSSTLISFSIEPANVPRGFHGSGVFAGATIK
jgi:hypothetical protein